jgi:HEPN domain-containing protein
MKRSYLYFILLSIIISCTPREKPADESEKEPKSEGEVRDELYQEVIEIHDIAMLKIETIMSLKNISIIKADSLRELESDLNAELIEQLEKSQDNLDEANKAMMVWMRGFRPPSDTVSHDLAMKYLRSEQDRIDHVNSQMDQVIKEASLY